MQFDSLQDDQGKIAAQAIMTTDTLFRKILLLKAARVFQLVEYPKEQQCSSQTWLLCFPC